MTMMITRFAKTGGGYRRLDVLDFEPGAEVAQLLTMAAQDAACDPRQHLQAWSFCHFIGGRMSSETWRGAHGVILEYMLNSREEADHTRRLQTILEGADRTNLGYLVGTTQTRYQEPTITLVFPLTEQASAAHYSRIASVLAAQIDCWESAPGILAPTHLVHGHKTTTWSWVEGPGISPESFIRQTSLQAQTIDPLQFERRRPQPQPTPPPQGIAADPGLFSW